MRGRGEEERRRRGEGEKRGRGEGELQIMSKISNLLLPFYFCTLPCFGHRPKRNNPS